MHFRKTTAISSSLFSNIFQIKIKRENFTLKCTINFDDTPSYVELFFKIVFQIHFLPLSGTIFWYNIQIYYVKIKNFFKACLMCISMYSAFLIQVLKTICNVKHFSKLILNFKYLFSLKYVTCISRMHKIILFLSLKICNLYDSNHQLILRSFRTLY